VKPKFPTISALGPGNLVMEPGFAIVKLHEPAIRLADLNSLQIRWQFRDDDLW
jgi:hypothetical protein